jgi:tetratricopeptide (TPR) repeat protein
MYPHPQDALTWAEIGAAALLLTSLTAAAIALRRRGPWLFVGWTWYLVMLVPVIGIVQVGPQAMADRYTYLPEIGLSIALACLAANVYRTLRVGLPRAVGLGYFCALGTCLLAVLLVLAWKQTSYWRDSETLWRRVLACTSRNSIAEAALAQALKDQGRDDEAVGHYHTAIRITPDHEMAHRELAEILLRQGDVAGAVQHYEEYLKLVPDKLAAETEVGRALAENNRLPEAIVHFRRAAAIEPNRVEAQYNLALALYKAGQLEQAIERYRRALEIDPGYEPARRDLQQATSQPR